ncbi:3'-5' exoribonuclease [Oxalicibacterium faecigallinarum]|uniref:Uncharacterized protein n=1 Tax=Oxalicibacterium faecigallinarum TaxID=573741 RepID=A0A8J3AQM3_9BURK|nr:3'-5' exoribonuclease [Oxalicibacterium faecigallinarum]GGI16929.1 hypothetical protein GCM10008066_06420 [Oxalicibacterium faecigallinarum]
MPLKVFIDTEFTDFNDPYLISIGMAAASGEEFYAEVPYPAHACSAFVRETVIPLLGRLPDSTCSLTELRDKIIHWLACINPDNKEVEICFDYQTDWDLFGDALGSRMPTWCRGRMIARNINKLIRYEFHKKHNLPEHHALYDAMANRYAFRERSSATS